MNKKSELPHLPDRCRLVLIVPAVENAEQLFAAALEGGDVASAILPVGEMDTAQYQRHCEQLVEVAHGHDCAVLVDGDSQTMGRADADGIFVSSGLETLNETIARFSPKRLVGYGGVKTRHNAMEAAEQKPDFLFLGRLDGDIRPEAHKKNMTLGSWCAEVMQISVVVMGGSSLESVVEVAECGADFVALSLAVFSHVDGPESAVAKANALLDTHAPRFADED